MEMGLILEWSWGWKWGRVDWGWEWDRADGGRIGLRIGRGCLGRMGVGWEWVRGCFPSYSPNYTLSQSKMEAIVPGLPVNEKICDNWS